MYEVPSVDVFLCLKLLLPFLATLELLTISISPRSALFVPGKNGIKKVPQLGRVIIKENVEIGCNSTIDRGSIGDTVLSENVMIDNLVHIAHNVKIGKNTIIAAMTGISGSTEIGDNVLIGGQVGISGHLKIGDNVKIAAKSGVMKDIPNNSSVGGYPALNIIDWHRSTLMSRKKK